MSIEVINLAHKLSSFSEHWSPHIAAELNDSYVKLAKLHGEFVWHHHESEDELFLVIRGTLGMNVRENGQERQLTIHPGEFVVIPRGVEHLPFAEEEVEILLIEPKTTLNTGNVRNERTRENLERV
jgi:mannose-6-phosphate isomerase-like protein (cupin superfamily)